MNTDPTQELIERVRRQRDEAEGMADHLAFTLGERDGRIAYLEETLTIAGVPFDYEAHKARVGRIEKEAWG